MTDQTQSAPEKLSNGQPAPAFTLTSDENKPVSLSDYAGKRLLIFFYPKAGTPGCTTQACGFREAFPKINEAHAAILGISPDSVADLAAWRSAEHLPYPLLSDTDHKVAEAYGAWGERSMYGKSYMGIIRSHFVIGPDGRLEDVQLGISPQDSIDKGVKALLG
jgi:peroxiredoxin Q/BCP